MSEDDISVAEELSIQTNTKKCKLEECFTAELSPTKKKVSIFRLSEKKTQDEFPVDPLSLDTSSFSAIESNMKSCFSMIDSIARDLASDDFGFEQSIFSQADLDEALSLLTN